VSTFPVQTRITKEMRTVSAALLLLLAPLAFADDSARQRAIAADLGTSVPIAGVSGRSLADRMKELEVPAVSYAVVEKGKVVLAAAHGDADVAASRRATASTLFQAASISKPVFAMGVMDLVERGKLSLDAPVNSLLRSWQLPENELTTATPVTMRMLLSHSAGTTVHGFPGYEIDETRPSIVEVLNGTAPANTAAVVVDAAPNRKFEYSGGGTTVAQVAITDQTGLPFPTFMRRTVLEPLGMTSSTYEQPLPESRRMLAATGYNFGGREVHGRWHVYPEMAAAGLWTTPTDLTRVIVEMQNALAGRPTRVLSMDSVRHMLTPRFPGEQIGLGFFVEPHGGAAYFTHNGQNEGFVSLLIGSADGAHGAVIMANSDSGGRLLGELAAAIGREYGWPGYTSTPLRTQTLDESVAAQAAGRYVLPSDEGISIRRAADHFEVLDLLRGWQPLYPIDGGVLARADRDVRYVVSGDRLTITSNTLDSRAKEVVASRAAADSQPGGDELLAAGSLEPALTTYREMFRTKPASVPAAKLNRMGYTYVLTGRDAEGIALLQLNTELYPGVANTWDSLAEALLIAGDVERARVVTEEELRRIDADASANASAKAALRRAAEKRLRLPGR